MVDTSQIYITDHALKRFLQRGGTKRQTEQKTKLKMLNLLRHAIEIELTPAYKTLEIERGERSSRFYFSTKFVFVIENNAMVTVMEMDSRKWKRKL